MSRKYLIRSKELPYHVTGRSNNREPFPCDLNYLWRICLKELAETGVRHQIAVHAFVLMSNHFHLIISTPGDDLGIAMKYFMQSITKIINTKTGRSGRVFGGRYRWSMIDTMGYFDCALKYVYRNPVKAGICRNVEDFSFSTLNASLGNEKINLDLYPPHGEKALIPNENRGEFLEWLNIPFLSEEDSRIQASFEKSIFRPWLV